MTLKEQKILQNALKNSKELKKEKNRIESLRKSISTTYKEKFSPSFSANVMYKIRNIDRQIEVKSSFFNSLVYDFKIIAAGAAVIFALLLTFSLINKNFTPSANNYSAEDITLDQLIEPIAMLEMEDIL